MTLDAEARLLTKMLKGKRVAVIRRHRRKEILIEFTNGVRLFIDHVPGRLDLSITKGT